MDWYRRHQHSIQDVAKEPCSIPALANTMAAGAFHTRRSYEERHMPSIPELANTMEWPHQELVNRTTAL